MSVLPFFLVYGNASGDGEVVALRLAHEEGDDASTTSRFVLRETMPHKDVPDYRWLYLNALDERRFGAMFSDRQNSTKSDRMEVRRDTDIGAWNRGWQVLGSDVPVLCI